jgi:hypothetical protein
MYFVFIHENRRMKPVEIVLRSGGGEKRKTMERVNLRYVVSTDVNITKYPPVLIICQ